MVTGGNKSEGGSGADVGEQVKQAGDSAVETGKKGTQEASNKASEVGEKAKQSAPRPSKE